MPLGARLSRTRVRADIADAQRQLGAIEDEKHLARADFTIRVIESIGCGVAKADRENAMRAFEDVLTDLYWLREEILRQEIEEDEALLGAAEAVA